MSDISIPGISSKYNTTKLIEDLLAAERIPLARMEKEVESFNADQAGWQQLNRNLGNLQRAAKQLYGFENPFSDKNALSSDERVLTGLAERTAALGNYAITIKQAASADRFLSQSLEKTFRVAEGNYHFSIGDESVKLKYRGGRLDDFVERLNKRGSGLLRGTVVRDTMNTQVLMIEAIPTGSKNKLYFQEKSRELAIETGMMRPLSQNIGKVSFQNIVANPLTAEDLPADPKTVELYDKSLIIQPSASLKIPFDETIILKDNMVLEYSYRTIEYDDSQLSAPGALWAPVQDGVYKGIHVRSSPNSFQLPLTDINPPIEKIDDFKVLKALSGSEEQSLPPITRSNEWKMVRINAEDLPSSLKALLVENNNTHRAFEIADIRVHDSSSRDNLEPLQAVDIAKDAIIEFRGITATRPSNSIDDLVDGITLNLKRASSEPVELSVEPDTKVAKDNLISFVYSYNQLITRILVYTSDNQAVVDELSYLEDEERTRMEESLGQFRNDFALSQLRNRLQNIVASPYPTRDGDNLSLLAQIGISTNASAGNFAGSVDQAKLRGYLEIDEEKLDAVLNTRIDAIRDLFGMDTTGDLVIDSGVGKAIDQYLTPYTQTGGFVSTRLRRLENQVKGSQEDMRDYEEHLKDYEADLKHQYGTMEAMLNQLENSSRDLDNFTQQQRNNR